MYVCGSGISQLSAAPGTMLNCSSLRTRESNKRESMRSDCASVPTRGSRLVGLNSMHITSVLGAGRLEQESNVVQSARANINHRGHRETRRSCVLVNDP